MHVLSIITAFTVLLSVVAAAPTSSCDTELPCNIPVPIESRSNNDGFTNADRLRLGLPPRAPQRRAPLSPARRNGISATPMNPGPTPTSEPAPEPTSTPESTPTPNPTVTKRGIIRIDRADGLGTLGYLSSHPVNGAQHRYQSIDNAMIIKFTIPDGTEVASQIELDTENSDFQSSFPRLSLVQGRDNTNNDLSPGSYHYTYVAGSASTAPGATPQNVANSYSAASGLMRTAESAVWVYDPVTQKITASWTNTDGSTPTIAMFTQSSAIYAGGDTTAFKSRYPSPVTLLDFVFVPL